MDKALILMDKALILIFFSIISSISLSYGYDPLDPHGNITVTWDYLSENDATYDVRVTIFNFQLFRHVDHPGWKLSWGWKGDEVIWKMWGAEATQQGNCSRFKGQERPHCCKQRPVIIDLLPGTPYNLQVSNCCKGGVLSSMIQDPTMYAARFQMNYNKASKPEDNNHFPENFTLGIPGYSCGTPIQVAPTRFSKNGRRWTEVLDTWNVTCIYSQIQAAPAPRCCVSLSAFYNDTIVPCPTCSCNCRGLPGANCVQPGEKPPFLQLPQGPNLEDPPPYVRCTEHMCPIRIHWHVKLSYREYWRAKVTITNLNFVKNYSHWNLVVLHPNLQNVTRVFSFNYKPLNVFGNINDTGMFWGVQYFNDMLLASGENGNAQTEILLNKEPGNFTFKDGWAFPRRISFNGDDCVMPSPDQYPTLPNTAHFASPSPFILLLSVPVLSVLFF